MTRLCVRWFIAPLLVLGSAASVAKDKPLSTVADLRYGVALYHYYQNQNLEAMSELMVAEKKGGIKGHGDNPAIMEGGFSMAYGLEQRATDLFHRLLDGNRPQKTRDSAWFYLAQMQYFRGDWAAAEKTLQQVSGKPHQELAPQVAALRFNIALQQEQLENAERLLQVPASNMTPYMRFNMGAALSRAGSYEQALTHFSHLEKLPSATPEFLALYDKSMTAAGYAALLHGNYALATQYFTKVRLSSPLANRALLGYGWAALEQGNYTLALMPWQELSKRPLIDEYTQEALVAIPYAYEKLGYKQAALNEFRAAEKNYLNEIAQLKAVSRQVQGYAIREALNIDRSTDINWLDQAQQQQLSPQLTYLIGLFSREDFQSIVRELRDLLAIQNQFQEWQAKLEFYSAMLNEREENRAKELDYLARQALDTRIENLESEREALAVELVRLVQQQDFLALVDAKDSKRLERILRAEKNVDILQRAAWEMGVEVMPASELAQLNENLRRQKGLMTWQAMEWFDERLWRAQKEWAQLDQQLAAARAAQTRIHTILDKGFDLQPYRQRIALANEQLVMQSTDIDHAIELSQDVLRQKVLAVLGEQEVRLQHYLAQARLSIARLLDQSVSLSSPASPAPSDLPTSDSAESLDEEVPQDGVGGGV